MYGNFQFDIPDLLRPGAHSEHFNKLVRETKEKAGAEKKLVPVEESPVEDQTGGDGKTVTTYTVTQDKYINLNEHPYFWHSWNLDPAIIIILPVTFLYLRGAAKIKEIRGVKVGYHNIAFFFIGVLTAVIALCSPVDFLADASFSMHMLQHMVLIFLSAPLICMSFPMTFILKGSGKHLKRYLIGPLYSSGWFKRSMTFLFNPITSSLIFNVFFWFWHIPKFYDLALVDETYHELEHVMFFYGAMIFWWPILDSSTKYRIHWLVGILSITVNMMLSGVLSAIIVFSDNVLYSFDPAFRVFDMPAETDQLVGALFMWVPGSLLFFIFLAYLFLKNMNREVKKDYELSHEVA